MQLRGLGVLVQTACGSFAKSIQWGQKTPVIPWDSALWSGSSRFCL